MASKSFLQALALADLQPLWDRYMRLLTREPVARDSAMAWSWKTMQPLIERAVAEVEMTDAERRVLLFCHPAFAPSVTTTTNLSSGLQILQAGDHAPAHRHAVAALRFMMQGEGAVTWVDGKRCDMLEGDLILTPAWCWHEHRNDGQDRVIWFDGLDVPLVQYLSATFLEFGPRGAAPDQYDDEALAAGTLPANPPPQYLRYSPRYRYSAASTQQMLDAMSCAADGSRQLRYLNPLTGGAVMPTLDCYALSLRSGATTRGYRSTSNAVVVVAQGSGRTQVGEQSLEWSKGDVFTLPHWNWISHQAHEPGTQLFLMTDLGLLDALGYLRTEYED